MTFYTGGRPDTTPPKHTRAPNNRWSSSGETGLRGSSHAESVLTSLGSWGAIVFGHVSKCFWSLRKLLQGLARGFSTFKTIHRHFKEMERTYKFSKANTVIKVLCRVYLLLNFNWSCFFVTCLYRCPNTPPTASSCSVSAFPVRVNNAT